MITLEKGQGISLIKKGEALRHVAMGTGWDAIRKKGIVGLFGGTIDVDLDASVLLYSGRKCIDEVWFQQLRSRDGSVRHSGDNRTGAGDGDDETITIDLDAVPHAIDAIVGVVNSFSSHDFRSISNAYTRLVDLDTGVEIARYTLSDLGRHTGLVMYVLKREKTGWRMTAIGETGEGRTLHALRGQIDRHL